jgi:hypothetical protein
MSGSESSSEVFSQEFYDHPSLKTLSLPLNRSFSARHAYSTLKRVLRFGARETRSTTFFSHRNDLDLRSSAGGTLNRDSIEIATLGREGAGGRRE